MQIKRSNDLKIKVQPFCAHPSKACGVQVVKKNSHCGAYPLEKIKYIAMSPCSALTTSVMWSRMVIFSYISWSLLTRIKHYWMQQIVYSSIISSLKARKILPKRELLAFNWILSNCKMVADLVAIAINDYTSSLMLSPMVSMLPCTACHRQAVELSKSRKDLCVITLSCKNPEWISPSDAQH